MFLLLTASATGCGSVEPKVQGVFINTSQKTMSISLVPTDHADKASLLRTVPPHSVGFFRLPRETFDNLGINSDLKDQWAIAAFDTR